MGEVAVSLFKSIVKVGAVMAVIGGFLSILTLAVSGVIVALNQSVVNDLLILTQIWLPFNIAPIFLWLGTAVTMYLSYRVSIVALNLTKSIVDG